MMNVALGSMMRANEGPSGEFFRVVRRPKSRRVLLCFSAINVPKGKFGGQNKFGEVDAHLVYLNCPENQWYLDGVPGLGRSIAETVDSLRTIIAELTGGASECLAFGGSMGGYGALLYGSLLDVDMILAMGVEFELGIELGNSKPHLKGRTEFPDLVDVVQTSSSECHVLFGEGFVPDVWCASRARARITRRGVHFHSIRSAMHSIPPHLDNLLGLDQVIQAMFDRDMTWLGKVALGSVLESPDLIELCYRCLVEAESGGVAAVDLGRLEASAWDAGLGYGRQMPCVCLGGAYRALGRLDEAIEVLDEAIAIEPAFYPAYVVRARCHLRARDLEAALRDANHAITLMRPNLNQMDWSTYLLVAEILLQLNRLGEAERALIFLLNAKPKHKRGWELLERVGEERLKLVKMRDRRCLS